MNEKTLSTHQFLKKFSKEQANAILTLKDKQSVTVGKLKLEREKEKPDAILIELYEETLKITIAIILRARLSFEKEKLSEAAKEKFILEAKLKALQKIAQPKSSESVTNFVVDSSETIYKLNQDNWATFLKKCLRDIDTSKHKTQSTRFFNALSKQIDREPEINIYELTNMKNSILEYLYKLSLVKNNRELVDIRDIGIAGAQYIQKGLELFFRRINYVPNSKE